MTATTDDSQDEHQHRERVRAGIQRGAELSIAYLLMNILAATIASYGLFANSPAVIIGAMIIAMLLGPITGISLALVDSDMKLLLRGLGTLVAGAVVVMATGLIIGTIHSDVPVSKEIMARTVPNLADLVVALAGGAAGAYATVSPRLSVALVGVAIATALVPPLTAATILLARGEVDAASGAFLLTFTNIVAIQFASSVVFWSAGFRRVSRTQGISFLGFFKSNAVSILILGVLAVVLTDSLHEVLSRRIYESAVRSTLQGKFDHSPGSHLVEVRFDEADRGRSIVHAVVRGPSPPSGAQVAALEATLPAPPGRRPVELQVRFVPTTIINRDGVLLEDTEFHGGE